MGCGVANRRLAELEELIGFFINTLALSELDNRSGTAKFDLILTLDESGGAIAGSLEYDLDLFDQASIDRLIEHYVAIVEAVCDDPELCLLDITLDALVPAGSPPAAFDTTDEFNF